jgi:xylobiose transport system permease protein
MEQFVVAARAHPVQFDGRAPLGLYKFEGQFGIDVPAIMAAVLLSVIPLLVLYVALRRQFIRGLSGIGGR